MSECDVGRRSGSVGTDVVGAKVVGVWVLGWVGVKVGSVVVGAIEVGPEVVGILVVGSLVLGIIQMATKSEQQDPRTLHPMSQSQLDASRKPQRPEQLSRMIMLVEVVSVEVVSVAIEVFAVTLHASSYPVQQSPYSTHVGLQKQRVEPCCRGSFVPMTPMTRSSTSRMKKCGKVQQKLV